MVANFQSIPEDLLLHIFSLLSLRDLGRLAQTSRYLKVVSSRNELWKPYCLKLKDDPHAAILLRCVLLKETRGKGPLGGGAPRRSHPKPGTQGHPMDRSGALFGIGKALFAGKGMGIFFKL